MKRSQREARYAARAWDTRHRVWFSTLRECAHGTERGYIEFGCRCVDRGEPLPDPDRPGEFLPWGCGPAGVAAAAARRQARRDRRRAADADGRRDPAIATLDDDEITFGPEDPDDATP